MHYFHLALSNELPLRPHGIIFEWPLMGRFIVRGKLQTSNRSLYELNLLKNFQSLFCS